VTVDVLGRESRVEVGQAMVAKVFVGNMGPPARRRRLEQ
jgi:hypothetical protein